MKAFHVSSDTHSFDIATDSHANAATRAMHILLPHVRPLTVTLDLLETDQYGGQTIRATGANEYGETSKAHTFYVNG